MEKMMCCEFTVILFGNTLAYFSVLPETLQKKFHNIGTGNVNFVGEADGLGDGDGATLLHEEVLHVVHVWKSHQLLAGVTGSGNSR